MSACRSAGDTVDAVDCKLFNVDEEAFDCATTFDAVSVFPDPAEAVCSELKSVPTDESVESDPNTRRNSSTSEVPDLDEEKADLSSVSFVTNQSRMASSHFIRVLSVWFIIRQS